MLDYILIQALNGLVIGMIYAVIAAGLTVIFSILKIVNFAHGEVYMMGGYFAYFAITLLGIPPLLAVVVAMLLSFLLSVLFERTLLTPLYSPTTERKGDYGISRHVRHFDPAAQPRADRFRALSAAPAVVLARLVDRRPVRDDLGPRVRGRRRRRDAGRACCCS